jgi:hypothetical protein
MSDDTLHTVSRLFLILCIAMLAAFCGAALSLPYVIASGILCCLAVYHVATMGNR